MQMLLDYPKEEKIARMIISPTSTGGVRGKLARDASSCWAERHRNSLPLSWSPASPKLVNILFSWTRNSLPLSWSPASLLLQELSFVQSPWRDLENLTLRRGRCMCQGANVFIYKIFNKLTKTILPMLHIRFAFPDIWTLMKQNSQSECYLAHMEESRVSEESWEILLLTSVWHQDTLESLIKLIGHLLLKNAYTSRALWTH